VAASLSRSKALNRQTSLYYDKQREVDDEIAALKKLTYPGVDRRWNKYKQASLKHCNSQFFRDLTGLTGMGATQHKVSRLSIPSYFYKTKQHEARQTSTVYTHV